MSQVYPWQRWPTNHLTNRERGREREIVQIIKELIRSKASTHKKNSLNLSCVIETGNQGSVENCVHSSY